eukprot:TRINITY_DN12647_c0_g1_i4.p1 TRINITY_DN12647_c0_g1~~TRINITY_DN12647_c0_g1_i4.p1  ORF type:complete len:397 (-),score=61.33 TRINITY_DN12647_c0_g1_i4:128-1318(-)
MRGVKTARIIGWGLTRLGKLNTSPSVLMSQALEQALSRADLSLNQVQGLIAIPSLAEPHFMEAHYLATKMGLLPNKDVLVRTIDTGGAGPVSGLLEATRMIKSEGVHVVAVCAGDAVSSLSREEFLKRADQTCFDPHHALPSPVIPNGYDRIAQWHLQKYGVTREQLAMCSVLMSRQAANNPNAITKHPRTLQQVLESPQVGQVTNVLECARRADGGAAIVVASSLWMERHGYGKRGITVLGGGEASGPLYPAPIIDETMFSCEEAAAVAYDEARLDPQDIDFFGLYDCFPICLIRAIEAVGLAPKGKGGLFIQDMYEKTMNGVDVNQFPINTHGGLLAMGAPWEAPAMFNIIEAIQQLSGTATNRQIKNARRALVYGNGGIFSASAVAILGRYGW